MLLSTSHSAVSSLTDVRGRALTIVSSVFRHASQFMEDRDRVSGVKSLPQTQHSDSPITRESLTYFATEFVNSVINEARAKIKRDSQCESLIYFATEFVNSVINEARAKIKRDSQCETQVSLLECVTDVNHHMYPTTKQAKDSHQSVFEMANLFVQTVLSEAHRRVDQIKLIGVDRFTSYSSVDSFKVKDGLEVVARCISRWSFNPHWYFKIIYNGRLISNSHSYFYTVRWSVPSLAHPVAQVTADIYFSIEVSPMTPPPVHMKVCYRLETDRCELCALKTPLLEKWLHTVIRRKLEAFQMFTF